MTRVHSHNGRMGKKKDMNDVHENDLLPYVIIAAMVSVSPHRGQKAVA